MKSITIACALFAAVPAAVRAEDSAWVQLWNGKDLNDWTAKFQGQKLGVNPDSVFRITGANLAVQINKQEGFGHFFYKKRAFGYYILRAEYKFMAEKSATGYPTWTNQNNGLMIHCQTPASMGLNQDFPNSIEVQLLGPKNTNEAPMQPSATWPVGKTANVCTPGTFIAYKGNNNYTQHCTAAEYPDAWKSTQKPWDEEWSNATARVLGDSLIQHFINGAKVLEYSKTRLDDGTPVKQGYISIQAEGTSTQFRKIEILDLVGCMDKQSPAYRSYFVKNDAAACKTTGVAASASGASFRLARAGRSLEVTGPGALIAEITGLDGKVAAKAGGKGRASLEIPAGAARSGSGLFLVRVESSAGRAVFRVAAVSP